MVTKRIQTKEVKSKINTQELLVASPAATNGDREIDAWVGKIMDALNNCVGGLIDTGAHLTEAKKALAHGGWIAMFESHRLPFSLRTAQSLMKIAAHPGLTNTKNFSHLPPSSSILHVLAQASEEKIQTGINEEIINPGMSLKDAKEFVAKDRSPRPAVEFDPAKRLAKLKNHILKEAAGWPSDLRAELSDSLQALADQVRNIKE